jgi:hypothetical protein
VGLDVGESTGSIVLELNGAADFDRRYSPPGTDLHVETAAALGL